MLSFAALVLVVLPLQAAAGSAAQCDPNVEKGFNYGGYDLVVNGTATGVEADSLSACCAVCEKLADAKPNGCKFYTFRASAKMCHPKYSKAGRKVSSGATSGARLPPAPPAPPAPPYSGDQPNIVFLIDESTDGRVYNPDPDNKTAAYMPNIRALQKRGATFTSFYSNSPVCAPSRTSMISGRHVHRVPHVNNGVNVNGAWNNAEGNPPTYSLKWIDVLQGTTGAAESEHAHATDGGAYADHHPKDGVGSGKQAVTYAAAPMFGKTDWTVGGHAVWNWLQCWTMYVDLPYNVTDPNFRDPKSTSGTGEVWNEQPGNDCQSQGTVVPNATQTRTNQGDWTQVDANTEWIRSKAQSTGKPWFAYQGMNIVHPPYHTSQYWLDKVDPDKVDVPDWVALEELHPCQFQSSMLKGCIPTADGKAAFYSTARRKQIRRIYLAMIAEYDSMVGQYVDAVENSGAGFSFDKNTWIFLTSDHGDMRMEHQQFYKMVPWEASSRVPLVVVGPGIKQGGAVHTQPTSLLDIYPTMLELTGFTLPKAHTGLDGYSLLPLLTSNAAKLDPDTGADLGRPEWVVSQGHMADNAMSWYLVRDGAMKMVLYGTGAEHPVQLFNITADPGETKDLSANPSYAATIKDLTAKLGKTLDFKSISLDVADYNKKMFTDWYMKQKAKDGETWKDWMPLGNAGNCPRCGVPGGPSGGSWEGTLQEGPALAALQDWINAPVSIKKCRGVDWTPGN